MECLEPTPPPSPPTADEWSAGAKYRVLFDSIDQGFCVIEVLFDAAGEAFDYRFVEVNPSFQRQTGLEHAVGRTMRELAPGHEEHWYRLYGDVARTGRAVRVEERAQALGRWYEVYAFRVGEPGEHRVAVLFNDITRRKLAEHALVEADRRKDEFIAILAHELRNPLAPLRNALEVMKLARHDPAQVECSRQMMERQVDHMVKLVDDLLDASRISRGLISMERQRVDLAYVVRRAIESAEPQVRQGRHELSVQLPPQDVTVMADVHRMTQALSNLLVNAAKYTPPAGRLCVTLERTGSEAIVRVADNGIGIPGDMLDYVFELFAQTPWSKTLAQGGLGIGLSIVRQIVALHDGSVDAQSAGSGQGSRFTVRLPLAPSAQPAPAPAQPGRPTPPAAPERRRVLVVDDNVDAAESLALMLDLLGHEVRCAFDGDQALRLSGDYHPQLVLMDLGMPVMDGYTCARRMREQPATRDATLVAVTGWARDSDRAATRDAGFNHHLAKPIEMQSLQALLAEAHAPHGA